jgi:hemerythrin-like domain-containing protein
VKSALATLDALEQEHRRADSLHAQADMLGNRCLEQGYLSIPQANDFRRAITELTAIYEKHIRIEDEVVFPIAGRILSQADKATIAEEMSARRKERRPE